MSSKKHWYSIQWYSDEDTKEDRKLILKLDLLIVPYAVLSYWVKYIDQANLNNAYVSGLKEDLGFYGNQLVQLQTFYTVGAVVGQIPFLFLFTYIPMQLLIPFLDVSFGIFTLLQYRASSFAELAAYRFLIGWFEAAYFPAMHYLFGSWYKGGEIGRRGGMFYVGLSLGTLTAGLIQAGASARLDGVSGLAGWRWMYIICACITIPIGFVGWLVIPGTPEQPNRKVLRQGDIDLGKARLEKAGHILQGKFQIRTLKDVLLKSHFWILVLVDILFWNAGISNSAGTFLLWIKSLNRYPTAKVNELGTISPALGIFYVLLVCFSSDLILGPKWAITLSSTWNAIGLLILTIWNVPESAKWFAFSTSYAAAALSSVFYGWVNTQLRTSPAQRSFTLVLINIISQSTTVWTPLLVFPTVQAPRYPRGYVFCFVMAILLIISTHALAVYVKRKEAVIHSTHENSASEYRSDTEAGGKVDVPVARSDGTTEE